MNNLNFIVFKILPALAVSIGAAITLVYLFIILFDTFGLWKRYFNKAILDTTLSECFMYSIDTLCVIFMEAFAIWWIFDILKK